ncbi:MAG TPA: DUF4443 domain-containing protein [Thermofilum sp.]|nr:DUF4443 domain-containing protein [Thermofilum sp.]
MSTGSSEIEVLMLLELAGGFRSRKYISRELGIGEGVARKILAGLKSRGYIEMLKAGSRITVAGREFILHNLKQHQVVGFSPFELYELGEDVVAVVAHLRSFRYTRSIVELRDAAVKAGADGALIIYVRPEGLALPPSNELLKKYMSKFSSMLTKKFKIKVGDAFIVSFSGEGWGYAIKGLVNMLKYVKK